MGLRRCQQLGHLSQYLCLCYVAQLRMYPTLEVMYERSWGRKMSFSTLHNGCMLLRFKLQQQQHIDCSEKFCPWKDFSLTILWVLM